MNNALCIIGPYDVDYLTSFFHFSMKAEATIYPRRCLMCTNPYSLANASRRKGIFSTKNWMISLDGKSEGMISIYPDLFPFLSSFFVVTCYAPLFFVAFLLLHILWTVSACKLVRLAVLHYCLLNTNWFVLVCFSFSRTSLLIVKICICNARPNITIAKFIHC